MERLNYPRAIRFRDANPLFARTFARSVSEHGEEFWRIGEAVCALLRRVAESEAEYERYLRSFRRFVVESLREQMYVDTHGKNRHSELDNVFAKVYSQEHVMDRYYLPGMMLSQFAFPNHLSLYRFYCDQFVSNLPGTRGLEIGPGHGLLTWELLRRVPGADLTCLEISPVACRFTQRLLQAGNISSQRYRILNQTLECLTDSADPYDFAVCSKVLEHLSDPAAFLSRVRERLSDGGALYLATDVGVGSVDHLQVFQSVGAVRALLECNGFMVSDEVVAPIYPDDPNRTHVLDYAVILRKEHS